MSLTREIFTGKEGRLSSKRIIGTILLTVAIALLIDAHFSSRELNNTAFNSMLYTGGIMIIGGVLENKFGGSGRTYSPRQRSRNEQSDLE